MSHYFTAINTKTIKTCKHEMQIYTWNAKVYTKYKYIYKIQTLCTEYKIQNKSPSMNVSLHSFNKYNYNENMYAQNTKTYKNTSMMHKTQNSKISLCQTNQNANVCTKYIPDKKYLQKTKCYTRAN